MYSCRRTEKCSLSEAPAPLTSSAAGGSRLLTSSGVSATGVNSVLASKVRTLISSVLMDSPLGVMTSERSKGFDFSSCRFTLWVEEAGGLVRELVRNVFVPNSSLARPLPLGRASER